MTLNNATSRPVHGFYCVIYLCVRKLFKMIWVLYLFHLFIVKDEILLSKEKTNLTPLILLFYSMFIQCSTCFGR